jgi:hypothetical protein
VDKFGRVLEKLREHGLLLASDATLLSVSRLILGGPIKGSWWGHPKGRAIWAITERLADHRDVIVLRLVKGKVTYVHRRLWPTVYTVGHSKEPWQSHGLSAAARAILARLKDLGSVRSDQLPRRRGGWTEAVAVLERRLLIISHEMHTENGAHAKLLESWEHWAQRCELSTINMTVGQARSQLEQATESLGASGAELLPWARVNYRR